MKMKATKNATTMMMTATSAEKQQRRKRTNNNNVDCHLNNVDQEDHVGGGVCGYVSLQIPSSSVITRGVGGKSNNDKKKGIAVTGAGICVGTVPALQTLKVNDKPKLKPKAKPKPKPNKAKEPPKLVQLQTYRMPLNKYPPPGTICRRRAYYITLENDTYSSIANKLGVRSWKDICYIEENYERYTVVTAVYKDDDDTNGNGTRTRNSNGMETEMETETRVVVVSSKSRFFENTLIRIPTDLCEVWRLKQLDQDRHKHGASIGMGSTDHSHVNNKGSKKRKSNSRKALEEEPNAYLEKIRAKRKRNADMLKTLGLGSPGCFSSGSGSGGRAKRRAIVEENGKPVSKKTKKSSVSTLQSQPRSTRLASANAIKAKEVKRCSTTSSNKRNVSKSKAKNKATARAEKVTLSNRADCKHYVGENVAKVFCDPDDDGDCTYRGTVESVEYKNSTPLFFVIYSDGDSEGVGLSELKGE